MDKKSLRVVFATISAVLYIAAATTIIVLCIINQFVYSELVLGIILITISLIKTIEWLLSGKHKNKYSVSLPFNTVSLILGILFLVGRIDMPILCFGWGILEIICSLIELQFTIPLIKKHKLCILEIFISVVSLIFGILLCIRLQHGLTVHLIYLSISLVLMAISTILNAVLIKK